MRRSGSAIGSSANDCHAAGHVDSSRSIEHRAGAIEGDTELHCSARGEERRAITPHSARNIKTRAGGFTTISLT
jgi:hypothetical protein